MRFLLIRPIEESLTLAQKLESLGHFSITDPVLTIEAEPPSMFDLKRYQALVFTSAVAVRIFVKQYGVVDLPIYTVGQKTALTAEKLGFKDTHSGGGDVNKLAQLIKSTADASHGPLLYLSAAEIAQDLNQLLKASDYQLDRTILYRAKAKTTFEELTIKALKERKIDYIPFYSSRSALIFKDILNKTNKAEYLDQITALCLSSNIEKNINDLPWKRTLTATKPNETELFNLIGINL